MQPSPAPILEPTVAEPELNFGPEMSQGLPSARSLVSSVALHALVIAGLMMIRFPVVPVPLKPAQEALSPTEIRIGNKLYYVARISGAPQKAREQARQDPAPRQARKGLTAPVIRRAAAEPAPAPAPAQPRTLPRAFIPPEVRQTPTARQTLIQPLSPPDLVPPTTPLPTFRILSAQIPKLAKPFVAPGRPKPPPTQAPVLSPPAPMEMVHADPQPTNLRPKLPLPRTPPPLDAPPVLDAPDLPPPIQVGDPVSILSLNDRDIPMSDRLVVPPGNIAQVSGEGSAAGSSATGSNSSARAASSSAAAASNNSSASSGAGTASQGTAATAATGGSASAGGSPTASSATGAASGVAQGPAAGPSNGSGTATIASASTGTNIPGGVGPGAPGGIAIIGGGGGARTTPGVAAGPAVITRPATGNFDAIVVQTSPLNQYPESRGLLTGRPIYSAYVSVGTAADWTFYFCIPGEKPAASSDTRVVQLGAPAAPVKAPYPTKLIRPGVALPSWEKYVLVHGYVNEQGRFEGLRVVRSTLPGTDQALLASLAGWEFRAATRDGVAVMVEFLMSIPAKGL